MKAFFAVAPNGRPLATTRTLTAITSPAKMPRRRFGTPAARLLAGLGIAAAMACGQAPAPQSAAAVPSAAAEPATSGHAAPEAPTAEREPGFHAVNLKSNPAPSYLAEESTGLIQSPINIHTTETTPGRHGVKLHYQTSKEHVTNLGHTVQVRMDPGSSLEFDGETYDLRQFHFHTPSEHLLDGVTYPMEMHLVHTLRDDPGQFLVVGVLFKEGQENPLLATLIQTVPNEVGAHVDAEDVKVDAAELFSPDEHFFHYRGSLTTPPYTETVTWLVVKKIHTASPGQIEALNELEGNNARHIQRLKSRTVDEN